MGPHENIGLWPFVTWSAYGSLPSELGNTWVVMLAVTIMGGTCRRTPFLLLGMCLVCCGSCGWLAHSMYGASPRGECVPVLMPVWHCFVCGIAVAQYAGLSNATVGLQKSQRETLHLLGEKRQSVSLCEGRDGKAISLLGPHENWPRVICSLACSWFLIVSAW